MQLGNGKATSFWLDHWRLLEPLAEVFPALFSHCVHPNCWVRDIFSQSHGVSSILCPRLTMVAAQELSGLSVLLDSIRLTDVANSHRLNLPRYTEFSSHGAYHLLHANDPLDLVALWIWNCSFSGKIKFFVWLLCNDRLNTRETSSSGTLSRLKTLSAKVAPSLWKHVIISLSLANGPVRFGKASLLRNLAETIVVLGPPRRGLISLTMSVLM